MASHLTLECFGLQGSSWLRGAQVLWLRNKPKSSVFHTYACQWVRVVCANMMHLIFSQHNAVYYGKNIYFSLKRPKMLFSLFVGFLSWVNLGKFAGTSSPEKIHSCP
ncbi:hypothetical protein AMECASPLE_026266 [Ameca splendens]|uniref:Uncharacterized protein n=1 Tax=Ameca splendens TaxID=208324 RepID=A0ABV0YRV2_9TELE